MNTFTENLDTSVNQEIFSIQEEYQTFEAHRAHFIQEGALPDNLKDSTIALFNSIHTAIYDLGIQGNSEEFRKHFHGTNKVIGEIIQNSEKHMYDDIKFALEMFNKHLKESGASVTYDVHQEVENILAN